MQATATFERKPSKLTDAQMRDFIVNGYLTIKTDLPRSVHETIYRKTQEYTEKEWNLGNNIYAACAGITNCF